VTGAPPELQAELRRIHVEEVEEKPRWSHMPRRKKKPSGMAYGRRMSLCGAG
jgi:hypothetical protein